MSCSRSYRIATDLPCIPHPCNSARPGLKLPRGINATYWNQIRYREIRAQRRYPGAQRCKTYTPSTQECFSTIPGNDQLRLAYVKGGSASNVVFAETLLRITDENLEKMVWFEIEGSPATRIILLELLSGEPAVVDLETQKLLNKARVEITYKTGPTTSETVEIDPICFAPYNIEFFSFFLQQIEQ